MTTVCTQLLQYIPNCYNIYIQIATKYAHIKWLQNMHTYQMATKYAHISNGRKMNQNGLETFLVGDNIVKRHFGKRHFGRRQYCKETFWQETFCRISKRDILSRDILSRDILSRDILSRDNLPLYQHFPFQERHEKKISMFGH
jgi:hypothetical protein